jgi:hypothetical protein
MNQQTPETPEIITQSHAARLRHVSRQAIFDLVKKGRLQVARDAEGNELSGMVYLSEVLAFSAIKNGRPRLSETQLEARKIHKVSVGEPVVWLHEPRDGFGFRIPIAAEVVKTGGKRVRLSFSTAASDNEQAWVKPEEILPLYDLPYTDASDNEQGVSQDIVKALEGIQRDAEEKLEVRSGGLVGNAVQH